MSETKMTKTQIINKIFKFFKANPSLRGNRSTNGISDGCMYNAGDGRHCAVGRCLLFKYKKMGFELKGNCNDVNGLIELNEVENLDEMLIPRYRGHSKEFWCDMQHLHDISRYWDKKGLTELGLENLNKLKKTYNGR